MNTNEYKYWFFYIKPEYLHLVCTEYQDSLLYAYTDNKEYAKIFKNQRDMNKFFIKKRWIDKSEVNYLAQNFMREFLIKKSIKTKTRGIGSEIIDYDLIITHTEDHIIQSYASQLLMINLWKCALITPYIFKNKYLVALDKLGFKQRFDDMSNWKRSNKIINKVDDEICADLLSIFIKKYGFLLELKNGEN